MEDKLWGKAYPLFQDAAVEIVKIFVHKGGSSSRHLHQRKCNSFWVQSGQLRIWIQCDDGIEVYDLAAGDPILTIPAGVIHQFMSLEEGTVAYELYTAINGSLVESSDILRFDVDSSITFNTTHVRKPRVTRP